MRPLAEQASTLRLLAALQQAGVFLVVHDLEKESFAAFRVTCLPMISCPPTEARLTTLACRSAGVPAQAWQHSRPLARVRRVLHRSNCQRWQSC